MDMRNEKHYLNHYTEFLDVLVVRNYSKKLSMHDWYSMF